MEWVRESLWQPHQKFQKKSQKRDDNEGLWYLGAEALLCMLHFYKYKNHKYNYEVFVNIF